MIGLPFNDRRCLGQITEVVAELVGAGDVVLAQLAEAHPTIEALTEWIRSLPQRDDLGDDDDGPRAEACDPPQRLRLPAPDPNCVERAALYIGVAELIDPHPVRQLATLDTPIGLHTFPVENGAPVILDPRVTAECLECGLASEAPGPMAITPREAIEWTAQLAEEGAAPVRNGPSRVRKARNAMQRLADTGVAPGADEIDAIGWVLALAERVAKKYGARAIAIVRSTAQAIADLADDAIARSRQERNADLARLMYRHHRSHGQPWVAGLARVAARVGTDVGAVALRTKLAMVGISPAMIDAVERELNREGLSLGPLAKPSPVFATFGDVLAKRAA
ncbi:MAG: hypothetical protein K8W52_24265 [Deltaproteobacteria bacterium]|nr:hypothetical protein [Deltaproteobacteria bacterium]